MNTRFMPLGVAVVGVMAAWCAARYAIATPVLWAAVMLLALWVQPADRCFVATHWLVAGLSLLGLSWIVALDHELALVHTLLFVLAALIFGLARAVPLDHRALGWFAVAIALTSLVAFWQSAGGLAQQLAAVDDLMPGMREVGAARLAKGRAFGTAALPGHFAALLLMATPLLIDAAARARRWQRAAYVVGVILATGGVILTHSLAAALVAAALVALASLGGLRRRTLVALAAPVALVAALLLGLRADLATFTPLVLRWSNWRTTAWVFVHNPWVGVGTGGVAQAALVRPGADLDFTPYAHNSYLQLLAEFGIAGAAVLIVGVVALIRLLRSGLVMQRGLTLAVAVVPLHNLVDFSLYSPVVLLPWAVLAGSLAGQIFPQRVRPAPNWFLVAVLVAGTLLATLTWRGEIGLAAAVRAPRTDAPRLALAASRSVPWTITPVAFAADQLLGLSGPDPIAGEVEAAFAGREWVRPESVVYAELRARLLLRRGSRGEALAWVREAGRRSAGRSQLEGLEAACRVPR